MSTANGKKTAVIEPATLKHSRSCAPSARIGETAAGSGVYVHGTLAERASVPRLQGVHGNRRGVS